MLAADTAFDAEAATALYAWLPASAAERPVPQPGPQSAFMDADADVVIFGGSAGPGKTWALLLDPIYRGHTDVPGFGGVIFRRTYPDITNEGGMWDEASEWYPKYGGTSRESPHLDWRFPSGAKISFAHMQHVKDRLRWKGAQIPFIGFDQLEEFEAPQFWYMLSRNRSLCGVRPYIRATVNPDPDSWVKEFLAPWVDDQHPEFPYPGGAVRWFTRDGDALVWVDADWRDTDGQPALSVTYIPATIYDNPILLAGDPGYLTRLRGLPLVDRARLLDGDWNMRYEGNMFKREWFGIVDQAPADLETIGRSWDIAGTEEGKSKGQSKDPDWTVGALVGFKAGVWYVLDVQRERLTPDGVDKLMDQTAALDGTDVEIHLQQDPGEAGKREVQGHAKRLKGYTVKWRPPTGDKVKRAKPMASAAEAGNLKLVSGPWNRDFINEAVAFPGKSHDDQIDAVSWEMLMQAFPEVKGAKVTPIPAGVSLVGGFSAGERDEGEGRYRPGGGGARYRARGSQ